MTLFAQDLAVLVIIGASLAYVAWQIVQTFQGRKSKLGSCCAKGCSATQEAQKQTAPKPAPAQFLPLANLRRVPRNVR